VIPGDFKVVVGDEELEEEELMLLFVLRMLMVDVVITTSPFGVAVGVRIALLLITFELLGPPGEEKVELR
jgi:hypothetical protein